MGISSGFPWAMRQIAEMVTMRDCWRGREAGVKPFLNRMLNAQLDDECRR